MVKLNKNNIKGKITIGDNMGIESRAIYYMGDGRRIETITMVSLLQRGMSMSGTNHVIRIHYKGCLSIG